MRLAAFALAGLSSIVFAAPALADIGPPPSCPPGTHSEYLMGRHCVRDGFHMEPDPNGGTRQVADDPNAKAPPTTAAPPSTAPPPAPPEPAKRGCGCGTAPTSGGAALFFAGVAAVVAWRRRRGR